MSATSPMAGIPAQESQSNAVVEEVNGPAGIASTISVPTTPTLPETSLIKTVCVQESNTTLSQVDSLIETHRASTSASPTSVDDDGYESDSGLSAYTTVATSVSYFTYENGRRYHRFREGIYNFPNDDPEQDREDMKHAMIHMLCGRLHFAPIRRGKIRADEGLPGTRQQSDGNGVKMLDMGTGTGIWAIEMGDLYPGASITGVDLSPIQPTWVPPNVQFMVDDLESPWLRAPNYYDYIHGRNIIMGIRDWPKLLATALEHLKPGGWLELQEIYHFVQCREGPLSRSHALHEFWSHISRGLAELGVDLTATLRLEAMMREAGFTNVATRIIHVPLGPWPKNPVLKTVGLYWRTILLDGVQPIALGPLTRGLHWTREEVEVWLIGMRKGFYDPKLHGSMPLYIICGQKAGPEASPKP